MLFKFFYIVFCIALVLGSVKLTQKIVKRLNINRWIVGTVAFGVLIVPSILFKNISPIMWNVMLLLFCILCIMFFEISSIKLQDAEIKGIINNNKKNK